MSSIQQVAEAFARGKWKILFDSVLSEAYRILSLVPRSLRFWWPFFDFQALACGGLATSHGFRVFTRGWCGGFLIGSSLQDVFTQWRGPDDELPVLRCALLWIWEVIVEWIIYRGFLGFLPGSAHINHIHVNMFIIKCIHLHMHVVGELLQRYWYVFIFVTSIVRNPCEPASRVIIIRITQGSDM